MKKIIKIRKFFIGVNYINTVPIRFFTRDGCVMIPNEGVEIKDFGLITFDLDQVHEVIEKIGLKFNNNGFLKDGNKDVKCACCDHSIKETNIGNILPGSDIVYCDNPICFVEYMDKHLHL